MTAVQNAILQLILDRRLGEYVLPPDWRLVAAGNYEADGGGVQKTISAMGNRFVHLNLVPSFEDWREWALLPASGIDSLVTAFLTFRPELLHKFDAKAQAFPSPRSWEFVSKIVKQKPAQAIELALTAGTVGHEAAIEFMAFIRLWRNLPNMDSILQNPLTAPVPTDVATLFAIASALERRATVNNIGAVLQYVERMPAEYGSFTVKAATARDVSLTTTPTYSKWAIAHAAFLSS